jgi:hypothetical protein
MRKITGAILILAGIVGLCLANWKTSAGPGSMVRAVDEVPGAIVNGFSLIILPVGCIVLLWGIIREDLAQSKDKAAS